MKHSVTGKQANSKMCLVCGLKNPFGLHTSFFELDNDTGVFGLEPFAGSKIKRHTMPAPIINEQTHKPKSRGC